MPDALGSIGNWFGTAAPALTGINAGLGMIGNVISGIGRGRAIGNLQSAEKKYANLSPEQLSGLVTRAEQPLSQDLLQNIGNLVQADLGTRGLSQAPGVFGAEEAQAIAPYKMQEQQNAINLIMRQLGLPIEYSQAILQALQGGSDPTMALLALILRNQQQPQPNQVPGIVTDSSGGSAGTDAVAQMILDSMSPPTVPAATPSTTASQLEGG